jgi:hypothetical protein
MNSWCWESFEEFKKQVYPIEHAPENIVGAQLRVPASSCVHALFENLKEFDAAHEKLRMLLGGPVDRLIPAEEQEDVCLAASRLVYSAECIFAYCRPLANTKGARTLISRKEISEHLTSYRNQAAARKFKSKAQELFKAADQFAIEIPDFFDGDRAFLQNVSDLPDELKSDFVSARNLMSLGFDEAGLIFSGRGLEGVIRRIARDHKITMKQPVERARFFEILTVLETKRFAHDSTLVVDEATKHLLQYSRAIRNNSAHPNPARTAKGYPQQAVLMAQRANDIWTKCAAPGVNLI